MRRLAIVVPLVLVVCGETRASLAVEAPPPQATPEEAASQQETRQQSARVLSLKPLQVPDVGAEQGIARLSDRVYLFGDRVDLEPPRGEIVELDGRTLEPTGRLVRLVDAAGRVVITHPTGLAFLPHPDDASRTQCWIGSTIKPSLSPAERALATSTGHAPPARAELVAVDFESCLEQGHLGGVIDHTVADDLAINGCPPTTVRAFDRPWVATADYGDTRPTLRLYDPAALAAASRTSEPAVCWHRALIGPYTQTLTVVGSDREAELVCVQNRTPGRGWRLDRATLEEVLVAGRIAGCPSRRTVDFIFGPPGFDEQSELEGWLPARHEGQRDLFVIATRGPGLLAVLWNIYGPPE